MNELDRAAGETSDLLLDTVFFGGGTPSLMDPHLVDRIMDRIRKNWSCANDIEVTMEANPSSVEAARFESYRGAGVNRVSLGLQALNDSDLKKLGRLHNLAEGLGALEIAQSCFDRVSFDLIYARQHQTLEQWEHELTRALGFGTTHMSLYQLTIEDGTAFGDRFSAGKLPGLVNDDLAADMFDLTQTLTHAAGFQAYEVSNHAKAGAQARHNMIYWRGGDYVGIGPGAHGRISLNGQRHMTEAVANPTIWLEHVQNGKAPMRKVSPLIWEDQATEYIMMSLRTSEGFDLGRLPEHDVQRLHPKITELGEAGLVTRHDNHIVVPDGKRILLNAILRELLT